MAREILAAFRRQMNLCGLKRGSRGVFIETRIVLNRQMNLRTDPNHPKTSQAQKSAQNPNQAS